MRLHSNTLQELELPKYFPADFFMFFITEFKQLKTLSNLGEDAIPQDSSFYQQLAVNTSVTNLKVKSMTWHCDHSLSNSLTKLPNIERIQLLDFNRHLTAGLHSQSLESLTIINVYYLIDWEAFSHNNPRIKELSIGYVEMEESLDMQAITLNLKELRKDSNLSCDEKFFVMIRQNCPDLKSLKLNKKSLKVDISTVLDIPGLIFRDYPSRYHY